VDQEREILNSPLYRDERDQIRSMIAALRRAKEDEEVLALHQDLLDRSRALKDARQRFERDIDDRRAKIRQAKERRAEINVFKRLSGELKEAELNAAVVRALQALYRALGDALVWREFNYQRPAIAALGAGDPVATLSDGPGLEAELRRLDELAAQGIFAILNDLTNCLRHGDLTVFLSRGSPRIVVFEEQKASGEPDPQSSQMRRLEKVVKLLNDGAQIEGAGGAPLILGVIPVQYDTHIDTLAKLIARARSQTYASELVEPELLIEAYDETNPAKLDRAALLTRHADTLRSSGFADAGDDLICFSASTRRLRDRKPHHTFAEMAPVPLVPLPLDDLTDLVIGGIDYVVTLHAGLLEQRLALRGINAQVARGGAVGDLFMSAERDGHRIDEIPATVREQVQLELLTIDTLIASIEWFLGLLAEYGPLPNMSLGYHDEAAVWEAAAPGHEVA
jgi:hypothetical protein